MADKIHIKIVDYDEDHNLLVAFASEQNKDKIDQYPVYSFQPHSFPNMTPDQIMEEIARYGISIVQQQESKNAYAENKNVISDFKDMVGKVKEFNSEQIAPTEVSVPEDLFDISVK